VLFYAQWRASNERRRPVKQIERIITAVGWAGAPRRSRSEAHLITPRHTGEPSPIGELACTPVIAL
jgi:hypothetical protein